MKLAHLMSHNLAHKRTSVPIPECPLVAMYSAKDYTMKEKREHFIQQRYHTQGLIEPLVDTYLLQLEEFGK